jgi:hypothetical protein
MPTGSPINPNVLYSDVSDVKRLTRGEDTNLNDTDIEKFIEQKTRRIEKETGTGFRELELSDVVLDVTPTSEQKRGKLNQRRRYSANTDGFTSSASTDKFIKVNLPNDRIRSIEKIELITDQSDGYEDITSKKGEEYRVINKRDGVIQIDHLAFDRTLSGRKAPDRYKGAKVRLTYRYGRDSVRPDIREACAKLACYELINSDAFGDTRSDESGFVAPSEFTERIKQEAYDIIDSYK